MIKNKIKIFLRGAYDSYNFGDDAIFISILYFLEKNLGLDEKNCRIYIQRNLHSFEKLNYKSHLGLRNGIEIDEIVRSINTYLKLLKFPKFMRLFLASFIIGAFFINIWVFRIFKKSLFFKDDIAFFKNLDVIHYIGGGYIADRWKMGMVYEYLIIDIAKKINPDLKIIGTGLGLGPFRNKIFLFFLKGFLNKFDYLFLREQLSFELCRKLNIKAHIKCCGDDALLLFPLFRDLRCKQTKFTNRSVGFNLKNFPDYNYVKIKKDIEKLLNLLQTENFEIKYFCFGQDPGPDDYDTLLNLNLRLPKDLPIYNPYRQGFFEFVKTLSKISFGIGFAYHFNTILSIMGIPSIAIYTGDYYKQKVTGGMNFFNNFSYVLDINNIQKSVNLVKDLISMEKEHQNQKVEELYNNMLVEYISMYRIIIKKR